MFRRSRFRQIIAALVLTGLFALAGFGLYRLGFMQGTLVTGDELIPHMPYRYVPFMPFGFLFWLPMVFIFSAMFLRLAFGRRHLYFHSPFGGDHPSHAEMETMLHKHPRWRTFMEAQHAESQPEPDETAPGEEEPETQ